MIKQILITALLCCGTWVFAQQQQIDSLLKLMPLADATQQKTIAFKLSQLYAGVNPNLAIDYAQTALDKATNSEQKLPIYQHLGILYFRVGNSSKAILSQQQALAIATETKQERLQAQAHTALGGSFFIRGNLSDALFHYLEALRFYEQQHESASIVSVYNGLANIYNKQNNFSKALEYNLKAITYYEASSDKFRSLMAYDQVGNMYLAQKSYVKAYDYFIKSLKLYQELNNLAGEATTRIQLGKIRLSMTKTDDALIQFQTSLALSKKLNMLPLQAAAYNAIAETYEQQRLYNKAIDAAKQASSISEKAGLKIEQEQAYDMLTRLYKTTSNIEKATTFDALSKEIKDSLYNDSTLKQLANLQLRYESEKKQQQIELQHKEQQILAVELLRERQIKNITMAMLVVLGVGLIVFVLLFAQNKRIAQNLKQQKQQLQQTNHAIIKQKEELGQLNTVKDRFFSIISHDLRNSLTTMKLYFDMVGHKDYIPSNDSQDFTKQVSSSVENTIDLLENLLVWAQTQLYGINPNPLPINLFTLIETNMALLGGSAHQKSIKLFNKIPEGLFVFADADMINLVFRNLISNAIKFTKTGGSISVACTQQHQLISIHVVDTGVGISKDALVNLFTKTSNPSTLGTANEKGTGLGLLLCKEFVEKNNGTITVDSEPNIGSTITVTFNLHG